MEDYERLRHLMVDTQIAARGLRDARVLAAMRKVPRHLFMPENARRHAYDDMALAIGEGQTISQPYMVAVMTEFLVLKGTEKVLEIGTGSGYQAAILAELAAEVFTIERKDRLAEEARKRLDACGYRNVTVIVGDGTLGLQEEAPFDRIIITAAAPDVPQTLILQLAEGGILVAPVGSRFAQELITIRKEGPGTVTGRHTPCVFVPLIGEHGWKE